MIGVVNLSHDQVILIVIRKGVKYNYHHHSNIQSTSPYRHNAQSYKSDDGMSPMQTSAIPSPPMVTKSRQEPDVISDWVFSSNQSGEQVRIETIPPSLKLMNNSSLSSSPK